MRSPVDLVELPFTFTQQSLLTERSFIKEAGARDVTLTPAMLEGLHRLRLLAPLLRVSRDRREILQAQRQNPVLADQIARWEHTESWSLKEELRRGRVHDGARFFARGRLKRRLGSMEYEASSFLYSPYQLMSLPRLVPGLPFLTYTNGVVSGIDAGRHWLEWERSFAAADRETAIAVSALEPIYLPQILRRLSMPATSEFDRYEVWRTGLKLGSPLRWLGVQPAWLRDTASQLLSRADRIDPLGPWFEVVREASPDRWKLLTGRARSAIDLRTAAELLLRYYEHLAKEGRAEPLPPKPEGRFERSDFEHRLRPKGGVDETLTRFGLSPHPAVLLVLEGPTEMLLVPRVMELLGLRTDDDFISIHDAEGVTKSITSLVGYAISPRGVPEENGKYLMLSRPPTRLLNVMDAEGQLATSAGRAKRKRDWVERIERALPREHRTPQMRAAIEGLVHIDVWKRDGSSFEFAHFTDRQLGDTIASLDNAPGRPSAAERTTQVATVRKRHGNLKSVLKGISKPRLADALWPILEARIERAITRGTEHKIPIVRMLDHATELARGVPRQGVLLPIAD